MGKSQERSSIIRTLREYWRYKANSPEDFNSSQFTNGLIHLAIVVCVIGFFFLLVHAIYRVVIRCGPACCRRRCCDPCLEHARGKRLHYRIGMSFLLVAATAALLSSIFAQKSLHKGTMKTSNVLHDIVDIFEEVEDLGDDLFQASGNITFALENIECIDDYKEQMLSSLELFNSTLEDAMKIVDEMLEPARKWHRFVKHTVQPNVDLILPIVILCLAIWILATFVSLLRSGPSTPSRYTFNVGSIWAGAFGLPAVLVILTAALVLAVAMADFCYISPADIITDINSRYEYIAYYLNCDGVNPLQADLAILNEQLNQMEAAWQQAVASGACEGPPSAFNDVSNSLDDMQASLDIADELLECSNIQPLVRKLVYSAFCRDVLDGFYRLFVVLTVAGFVTLTALFLVPCAMVAFWPPDDEKRLLFFPSTEEIDYARSLEIGSEGIDGSSEEIAAMFASREFEFESPGKTL